MHERYYTEKLVRLPNLSIYYEPVVAEPVSVTREGLGLRAGATAFWSAQSLFKYLPQYDDVFVRIAQAVGDCQFVFLRHFGGPSSPSSCSERLERAFCGGGHARRASLRFPQPHEPKPVRRRGRTL